MAALSVQVGKEIALNIAHSTVKIAQSVLRSFYDNCKNFIRWILGSSAMPSDAFEAHFILKQCSTNFGLSPIQLSRDLIEEVRKETV